MFASDGIDRGKKIGIIISNNLQVEKGCHAMTNATLRGKPDAGNPHVRFDEGEVASAKPRRGSLLYKEIVWGFTAFALLTGMAGQKFRRLSVSDYRDRVKAGWLGQIAGVSWGAPTEFQHCYHVIPEDKVGAWRPQMINEGFWQDDLYVEMTFLRTLETKGFDVPIREAGIDFANSKFA